MKALKLFPIFFLITFASFAQASLITASGTDTYTATGEYFGGQYISGQMFNIKFTNANTGPSTININSKGAVSLVKVGGAALTASDIKAAEVKLIVYDGTNMQIVGGSNWATSALGDLKLTTVGSGLYIKEGTNATMGIATLVAGTVTVSTTKVTANSRILITTQTLGGTIGTQYISARTAGTSFTITSTSGTDTSTVAWFIVEPN